MVELGVLKRISVRDVWPHEALHFTKWLAERIDELGTALGLCLELVGREIPVGRFSVDLLARDVDRQRPVVIENQLYPTDHDHLGKLITYAAGLDAAVIVWISPEFCEEHRAALYWLNAHTDNDVEFFGVTLETLQIDDSRPAVNFKVLASPNGWQRAVSGSAAGQRSRGGNAFYQTFFTAMLQDLGERGMLSRSAPSDRNYQIVERVFRNIQFAVAFSRSVLKVQCCIETPDSRVDQIVFAHLREQQNEIQEEVSESVGWGFDDDRNRQTITLYSDPFDRNDADAMNHARVWAVGRLLELRAALMPRLETVVPAAEAAVREGNGTVLEPA